MRLFATALCVCVSLVGAACKTTSVEPSSAAASGPPADNQPAAEIDAAPAPDQAMAAQGQSCSEMPCEDGLECVSYYGIAGPRGPEFRSCEIRCGEGKRCPDGQTCRTIADGPGQVCR